MVLLLHTLLISFLMWNNGYTNGREMTRLDRVSSFIRRVKNDDKLRLKVAVVGFALFVYFAALSFTFAWFTSKDHVTNRFFSESLGLELREPNWDSTGMLMATRMEPGMHIPKDPYAVNVGNLELVVRFRVTVRLDQSEYQLPQNPTDGDMLFPANGTARKIAILRSLAGADGRPFVTVEPLAGRIAEGNSVSVNGSDGNMYLLRFTDTSTNDNGDQFSQFLVEVCDDEGSEEFDLYLYYIGDNPIGGVGQYITDPQGMPYTRDHTSLAVLPPDANTPKLFEKLVCPVYKKDYLTVFDRGFDVNVYVEGILYREFEEHKLPCTVESFRRIAEE